MITSLIASLVLGGFPQEDRKVTLDMVAMTMDKACDVLSNAFGERYIATPSIKSEVLVISVKDVPASTLRGKIAKALNAYIEKKDDIWYIGKSPQQIKAEADYDEAEKNQRIVKMINKAKERLAKEKPFDRALAQSLYKQLDSLSRETISEGNDTFWRRSNKIDEQGPANRMINRLLPRLPAEMFTKLKMGERVVFSNRPTPMQIGLPVRVDDILANYAQERNLWADVTKGAEIRGPKSPGGGTYYIGTLGSNTKPLESAPTTLLLRCTLAWNNEVSMDLTLADARAKIVGEANFYGGMISEEDMPEEPKRGEKEPEKLKDKLVLSDISKRFQNWSSYWGRRVEEKDKVKNPDPIFFQPELRDPLSYAATEVLMFDAKKAGKQLVANANDSLMYIPEMPDLDSPMVRMFGDYERVVDGDFILYSPKNRHKERRDRMSREDLGKLMRIFVSQPKLSIEQEASFSFSIPDQEEGLKPMMALLEAAKGDRRFLYNDIKSLRLIASLTPQERKMAAVNEKGIYVSQLNPKARALIHKYVYSGERYEIQFEPDFSERPPTGNEWEEFYNGLKREPTYSMPNGIPGEAMIKITDNTSEVVKTGPMQRRNYTDEGRFMDANELAWTLFSQSRPDLYPWAQNEWSKVNTNDLRLFQKRDVQIEIHLAGGLKLNKSASQAELTNPTRFTINNMPADFKAKYDKAWKEHVEQSKHQSAPPPGDGDGDGR